MNILLTEIKRSLLELELGIAGALNVTDKMEALATGMGLNKVSSFLLRLRVHNFNVSCLLISCLHILSSSSRRQEDKEIPLKPIGLCRLGETRVPVAQTSRGVV